MEYQDIETKEEEKSSDGEEFARKSSKLTAALGVITAVLTLATAALGVVGVRASQQKNEAEDRVSALSEQVSGLESQRDSLQAEVEDLERQRDTLQTRLEDNGSPGDNVGPTSNPAQTGLTYLSDEEMLSSYSFYSGQGVIGGEIFPHSVVGSQETCGEESYESYAEYDLGRRFDTFTATVGLSDTNEVFNRKVDFEVYVDNELTFEQSISAGEAAPVDISLTGGLRLRLVSVFVIPDDPCGYTDQAVWGDAALS